MDQNERPEAEKKRGLLELHESEEPKKKRPQSKVLKEIREWIISFAVALVIVFIIRSFFFTIIRVQGPSMSDTLLDKDRLFATVLDMRLNGPDRFDVVILHYPDRKENFVKRVVGLPGDVVEVKNGVLSVNGVEYDEPYLSPARTQYFSLPANNFSVTLGEDEYFVMGDNRDNSNDSRAIGFISRDMFVGKVRQIIWPLNRWETVEGAESYNHD